jgi:hypothetical protein
VQALILAAAFTLLVNLPFGYWRAGTRKFSPAWFVAVHGPVPLVVAARLLLGVGFRWANIPVLVAAFFAGQLAGGRLRGGR